MNVLAKLHAAKGLTLTEAPIPTYNENEVLIKIHKTAICGTDLHIYQWDAWAQKTIPVPMHVGHEFAGEIIELGSHAKGFKIGDRVSGEGHITCGHCRNCRGGRTHLCRNTIGVGVNRPGCFAEYLSIPAFNTFKLPDNIPVHTTLSFDLVGEDVLITGAGPIGIMACAIAKQAGARFVVITDINDYRLNLAKKMGATAALNVKACKSVDETVALLKKTQAELGMTEGFDVGLEMSGFQPAITSMTSTMNHGGRLALLGLSSGPIELNWDHLIFKGLTLKGIYGREMFETWYKMVSLIQSGLDLTPVLTHEFHYTEFEKAFELMQSGQCGKVILDWSK
ncbi:MAG: L-threonine 3-dehydrogenase [Gammaproteobacteria bacterium]|nr:L-threonine 3-dehydrogenase [Gammaproteobacteria bacterium]